MDFFNNAQSKSQKKGSIDKFINLTLFLLAKFNSVSVIFRNSHGRPYIETTAKELRTSFPQIKGFSRRNLYAMRQWYLFYSKESEFVPQGVAQLPWGHNRLINSL